MAIAELLQLGVEIHFERENALVRASDRRNAADAVNGRFREPQVVQAWGAERRLSTRSARVGGARRSKVMLHCRRSAPAHLTDAAECINVGIGRNKGSPSVIITPGYRK